MMGHPAVRRENYDRGSPVWQADKIRAPLLIVHGLQDPIVHPLQSEELVEALKREGKSYEFHRYDGAGHGFFAVDRTGYRPEQAVDAWGKVFEFYGKHLSA